MNKTLFKTYMLYFIVLVAFVLIRIASSLGAFSFIKDVLLRSNVATIIIQILIMFVLPFLLCLWIFKDKPKDVFKKTYFNKISFKCVLLCILLGILMFILNISVSSFFNGILHLFGYSSGAGASGISYDTFGKFMLGVVFTAILPAFSEEFLHRGILMRNVGKETNYKKAILISAVCFGLMHLNIEQFFYATILGLIIGFVGAATDSIIPCMILHFMNNFLSVYLSYAQTANLPGGDFYARINSLYSNNSPIFSMIFSLFVLTIIIGLMCYIIFNLFKNTRLKNIFNSLNNVQMEVSGDVENKSSDELSKDFEKIILPQIKDNKSVLDVFLPPVKQNLKKDFSSNIFLYCILFLGIVITIFTFLWGLV